MLWAITALTFLATFGVLAALFYAFSSQGAAVADRLSRLANSSAPVTRASSRRRRNSSANVGALSCRTRFPSASPPPTAPRVPAR